MQEENQEKVEEGREPSSSTSHPHSSSMEQESEDAELVRQIINNPLVSFIIICHTYIDVIHICTK